MRSYVEWIIKYRLPVIVVIAIITIIFAGAASTIKIDIDRKNQLPANHPLAKIEDKVNESFGGARVVAIAIVPKQGTIYAPSLLAKIQRISDAVEALPGVVHSNVLSMGTQRVKSIEGDADGLVVKPLLEKVPTTAKEIDDLKHRVNSQTFYTPLLVSKDGRAAAVLADFRESKDLSLSNTAIHEKLQAIVTRESDASATVYVAGMPVWLSYLDQYAHQMSIYLFIAVLIIAFIHYEAFRTVQAMLLPLVTAFISVIWAMGWLGLSGLPMDTWNSMTPILVLAVAAGHAVQILKRYYEEYEALGENRAAIVAAVDKVGPAMILAGIMAAIGFASLAVFDIRTVRVFGLISAAGILSALVIEMTLIPAVRSMLRVPDPKKKKSPKSSILDKIVIRISELVLARPGRIVGLAATIAVLAVAGISMLTVNNSFNGAMPVTHPYRVAEAMINQYFGGTNTMNILIDTQKADGVKQPSVMRAMNDLQLFLAQQEHVGATQSLADYVKRLNQGMHGDDPGYFTIPGDQATIAQYLFLYSMSSGPDDFDMLVDKDYRKALIRVFSRNDDYSYIRKLFSEANSKAISLFPQETQVSVAGGTMGIAYALNETVVREKIINIVQVLAIIFVFGSAVFRSFVAGLLILIPSTLAMLVNLGVMGVFGIPLSLGTAATSALTISIGADYAVYLLFRLREESRRGGDAKEQLRRAMRGTGQAIFYVSSAIAAGYSVLIFTGLLYYRQLGSLVASSMVLSSLAAITIIPALVKLFHPRFISAGKP